MTATISRQIATGAAAFLVTALLLIANAPDREAPADGAAAGARVLAVVTRHG